jgi:hypothetical protein
MTPDFLWRQDNTNPGIHASKEEEPDLIRGAAVRVTQVLISNPTRGNDQHSSSKL